MVKTKDVKTNIASYIKNLGKSVVYSSVDVLKETAPSTAGFIETNQDLFKDVYSAVKNYKTTYNRMSGAFKASKVYEAADVGINAVFQDLRTGKFYNKEREDEMAARAGGFDDMGDFDFDDASFAGTSDDDDWGMSEDVSSGDKMVASTVETATRQSGELVADTVARSSKYIVDSQRVSTNILYTQNTLFMNTMSANMDKISNTIHGSFSVSNKLLQTMGDNSKIYYETTTKLLQDQNAMMTKMLEMQTELYENTIKRKKEEEQQKKTRFDDIVDTNGMPDLKAYAKNIQKNLKGAGGSMGELLFGGDGNMLLAFVSNPLKFIPDLIAKSLLPANLAVATKALDKSLGGLFAGVISMFNRMATNDESNPIMKKIGEIFGIRDTVKSSLDTSKYNKGEVPFDGIVRKSIVEVIPTHLRKIESLLSGSGEKIYDYEAGKWVSAHTVKGKYNDMKNQAVKSAYADFSGELAPYLEKLTFDNKESMDQFTKDISTILGKMYTDGTTFKPKSKTMSDDARQFGVGEDNYRLLMSIVNTMSTTRSGRSTLNNMQRERLESRSGLNRRMNELEGADSIYNSLFNGDIIDEYITRHKKYNDVVTSGRMGFGGSSTEMHPEMRKKLEKLEAQRKRIYDEYEGKEAKRVSKLKGRVINADSPYDDIKGSAYVEFGSVADKITRQEIEEYQSSNMALFNMLKGDVSKSSAKGSYKSAVDGEKSDEGFMKKLIGAATIGDKFKVITDGLDSLMKAPSALFTKMITQADEQVYNFLFSGSLGEKDSEGKDIKGLVGKMAYEMEKTMNNLLISLDINILNPLKEKLGLDGEGGLFGQILRKLGVPTKEIGNEVKSTFKSAGKYVKDSLVEVYGPMGNKLLNTIDPGRVTRESNRLIGLDPTTKSNFSMPSGSGITSKFNISMDNIGDTVRQATDDVVSGNYKGSRYINKTGLTAISKGEMIIPADLNPFNPDKDKVNKDQERRNERKTKMSFAENLIKGIFNDVGEYADGTTNAGTKSKDNKDLQAVAEVMSALAGVDNKKSKTSSLGTFMNRLIGDPEKDDEVLKTAAKDALVTVNKHMPKTIAKGLVGGGIGLLLGGPLVGAAIGAGVAITENSTAVQDMLFGKLVTDKKTGNTYREKGGVISPELQRAVKQYAPDMGKFGIAGAAAGLLTPFGPVGGMMLGAAFGFANKNERINEALFGDDDGLLNKDVRKKIEKAFPAVAATTVATLFLGPFGLAGNALLGSGLGMLSTSDAFKDTVFGEYNESTGKRSGGIVDGMRTHIVEPMKKFGKDLKDNGIDFIINDLLKPIKDAMKPIGEEVRHIITGAFKLIPNMLDKIFENTLGTPLSELVNDKLIKPVGNFLMGTLKVLTKPAKALISAPSKIIGGVGNILKKKQIRQGRAGYMTAQERLDFRGDNKGLFFGGKDTYSADDEALANMGIDDLQRIRDVMGFSQKNDRYFVDERAGLMRKTANAVSQYFDDYGLLGNDRKKILQAINSGKLGQASKLIGSLKGKDGQKLTIEQQRELRAKIAPLGQQLEETKARKATAESLKGNMNAEFKRLNLNNVTKGNMSKYTKMLDSEINDRLNKNETQEQTDQLKDSSERNTDRIITGLENIVRAIRGEELITPKQDSKIAGKMEDFQDQANKSEKRAARSGAMSAFGLKMKNARKSAAGKIDALTGKLLGTNKHTKESEEEEAEELDENQDRNSIVSSLGKISKSFTSWIAGEKEKDEEEEEDPLWKKIATGVVTGIAGLAAIGAIPQIYDFLTGTIGPAIGAGVDSVKGWYETDEWAIQHLHPITDSINKFTNFIKSEEGTEYENNGLKEYIIGEDGIVNKGIQWLTGTSNDGGLPQFYVDKVLPTISTTLPGILQTILSPVIFTAIQTIPALVEAGAATVKEVLSWDVGAILRGEITYDDFINGKTSGSSTIDGAMTNSSPSLIDSTDGHTTMVEGVGGWLTGRMGRSFLTGQGAGKYFDVANMKGPLKGLRKFGGTIGNIGKGAINTAAGLGDATFSRVGTNLLIKNSTAAGTAAIKSGDNAVSATIKAASEGASDKTTQKFLNMVAEGIEKLFSSKTVVNTATNAAEKTAKEGIEKSLKTAAKNFANALTKKLSTSIAKTGIKATAKIASFVASGGLIAVAFAVVDFSSGMIDADNIFGVTDATLAETLLAGLFRAVNGTFCLGLIPEDIVMDLLIEYVLPILGVNVNELEQRRAEAEAEVAAWNEANGTDLTLDEYNNKDKFVYKLGDSIKDNFKSATDALKSGDLKALWTEGSTDFSTLEGGISSVLGYVSRTVMTIPTAMVSTFKKVVGILEPVIQEIPNITNDSLNITRTVKDGDVFKLWESGYSANFDSFGNSLRSISTIVNKVVMTPTTIVSGVALAIGDFIKPVVQEIPNIVNDTVEINQTAASGDVFKLWESGYSANFSTFGNSLRSISTIVNKVVMTPSTIVSGVVLSAGNLFSTYTETLSMMSTDSLDIQTAGESGDVFKLWESGFSNDFTTLPNGLRSVNTMLTKILLTGPTLVTGVMSFIGDIMDPVIKSIANIAVTDQTNAISALDAMEAGDFTGLWKSGTNDFSTFDNGILSINGFIRKFTLSVPTIVYKGLNTIGDALDNLGITDTVNNVSNKIGGFFDSITGFISYLGEQVGDWWTGESDTSGTGIFGRGSNGHLSQLDSKFAMRFNTTGDKYKQTMADSGCGPVAAATVVNNYNNQLDPKTAAKYALDNGYKEIDGGTKPQYFKDILGRQGISTSYAKNGDDIMNSLNSGNQVVLMGKGGVYGNTSHYMVAKGVDGRGNMIIDDPNSRRGNSKFRARDVLGKTSVAINTTMSGNGKFNKAMGSNDFSQTVYQDLGKYSSLTANDINTWIASFRKAYSPFHGNGQIFVDAAKATNLDPRYLVAHAATETGWGTSTIAKNKHNYFGIHAYNNDPSQALPMGNTMREGIIAGAEWIKKNYYSKGQKTVYSMAFAPLGKRYAVWDNGDPNDEWVRTIGQIMESAPKNNSVTLIEPTSSYTSNGSVNNTSSTSNSNSSSSIFDMIGNVTSGISGMVNSFIDPFFDHISANNPLADLYNSIFGSNQSSTDTSNESTSIFNNSNSSLSTDGNMSVTNASTVKDFFLQNLPNSNVSSDYGMRQLYGQPNMHNGIDFSGPSINRTPVPSITDGKVITSTFNAGGFGHYVVVQDSKGYKHFYAHLDQAGKSVGSTVKRGDILGYVGSTGNSTGPHLHYEIRDPSGTPLNPNSGYDYSSVTNSGLKSVDLKIPTTNQTNMSTLLSGAGGDTDYTKLITTIIEILLTISTNSDKLSEIVKILSENLGVKVDSSDVTSSDTNSIKQKLQSALSNTGSPNGMGTLMMDKTTETIMNAMNRITAE